MTARPAPTTEQLFEDWISCADAKPTQVERLALQQAFTAGFDAAARVAVETVLRRLDRDDRRSR